MSAITNKKVSDLLLTGGTTRPFSGLLGEANYAKHGVIAAISLSDDAFKTLKVHKPGKGEGASILPATDLTSASLHGDELIVCSRTEVFIFEWPSLDLVQRIGHPYFNDLHHAVRINGLVYVAATGVDAILSFDSSGQLVSAEHAQGLPLWHRRSPDVDYRQVASTKPRDSHPNFVFELDGDIWVTRFEQRDAVNLANQADRIDIGVERVHDGLVAGGKVYFTSVNGCVIVADADARKVDDIIDLNEIDDRGRPLGWCRGLAIVDDLAYVGFSKLRSTKIEENLRWIKQRFSAKEPLLEALPARVGVYDLSRRRLLREIVLPDEEMNTVFSVLPLARGVG